ncbi:Uncharacterised protein [Mycobacteroides abscessus]|nr:Uncharacterised protein [Mycobacteroides abscessus]
MVSSASGSDPPPQAVRARTAVAAVATRAAVRRMVRMCLPF